MAKLTNPSYSEKFYYLNNKLISITYLTQFGDSTASAVTYDAHGNIHQIASTTYNYNAANQLASTDNTLNSVVQSRIEFEFNSSGQLITKKNYDLENGQLTLYRYFTYTYGNPSSKNPVTRGQYFPNGVLDETITYEYDNKYNPYVSSPEFVKLSPDVSENNITKTTSSGGGPAATTSYTYNYNDKGFPVSATQSGSTTQTITYSYNCK